MIKYSVSAGKLIIEIDGGYSGQPGYKNDSNFEHLVNFGPIPRGEYKIQPPRISHKTGPFVLDLTPLQEQARDSGFQIHGDAIKKPGTASTGCIVYSRKVRELLWEICEKLGDCHLMVVD